MLPLPIFGLCTSSILPISPGCARGHSHTQALQVWCHEGLLLRPPHMPALRLCSETVSPEVCRDQVLLFDALKRAPVVSPSSCQFLHICPCTWALQGVTHVRPLPEGRCTLGECGGREQAGTQSMGQWLLFCPPVAAEKICKQTGKQGRKLLSQASAFMTQSSPHCSPVLGKAIDCMSRWVQGTHPCRTAPSRWPQELEVGVPLLEVLPGAPSPGPPQACVWWRSLWADVIIQGAELWHSKAFTWSQ